MADPVRRRPRNRRMKRAVRRHGLGWALTRFLGLVLIAALVLAAVGIGLQHLATERDARRHPPPGRMVSIDGRRLHLNCAGSGEPTVILDGGLGEWSIHWVGVQARLIGVTRVCAYDRAGYGWSPRAHGPEGAAARADDLHALLLAADVPPPYVLVGHGAAGFHLTGYAALHPGWVAGLVLVDAVPPDMAETYARALAPVLIKLRRATPAAELGLLRFTGPPKGVGPDRPGAAFARQGTHPGFYETYLAEAGHLTADAEWAANLALPPDLPVIWLAQQAPLRADADLPGDLAAERYDRLWVHHQAEMAARAPRGVVVMVPGAGRHLLADAPELVADTVARMVAEVRGPKVGE